MCVCVCVLIFSIRKMKENGCIVVFFENLFFVQFFLFSVGIHFSLKCTRCSVIVVVFFFIIIYFQRCKSKYWVSERVSLECECIHRLLVFCCCYLLLKLYLFLFVSAQVRQINPKSHKIAYSRENNTKLMMIERFFPNAMI